MSGTVREILQYQLKAGAGAAFHQIMLTQSLPLHRTAGIELKYSGISLIDEDRYCLIREFNSVEEMHASLEAFYASEAWLCGPRQQIIAAIESSHRVIIAG